MLNYQSQRVFFYEPSTHITSFITSFFFVVLLLHPDHSAIMNDPDDFGFGDVSPNTLEAEHQQEQEPEQESNNPDDLGSVTLAPTHWKQSINKNKNQNKNRMIWMTLGLVMLAPTHWKQNINKNKNKNIIQAHNEYWQPLLRRRDKGTQYRRNFVICTMSDDNRRMDNHRESHAVL